MSHELRIIREELARRGAKTFGSLARCTQRLNRFLDAERRIVTTPPPPPPPSSPQSSHFPLNEPPSIVRFELESDDLNAARILCECSRIPVNERVDRLEMSLMELLGNENIYHRMEDIEARIRRLERIADTTEQRVYALEKISIYKEQIIQVPTMFNNNSRPTQRAETDDSIRQSSTDCPSINYTLNILEAGL